MSTEVATPQRSDILQWGAWPDIFGMNDRLGQVFDTLWRNVTRSEESTPRGELTEADGNFTLELELPGVAKDDIDIQVTGRNVSVTATRHELEKEGVVRHSTRTTGKYSISVLLPVAVQEKDVNAKLDDGVLHIELPKVTQTAPTHVALN